MPAISLPRDRRFWTIVLAGLVVATLAAVAAASLIGDDSESTAPDNPLQLEQVEPSDDLARMEIIDFDGGTRTFRDAIDPVTPTVVNFFASTCTPCRLEMPAFQEVARELEGKIKFLGLAVNDRPEDALALVEETGVTYEVARDRDGTVLSAVGGFVMPTTAFVGPDGNVVAVQLGEMTAPELRTMIDEVFA